MSRGKLSGAFAATLLLGMGVGWVLATGLQSSGAAREEVAASLPSAPPSYREEFEAIADRVTQSKNAFVGRGRLDELTSALAATTPGNAEYRQVASMLAEEHLRIGSIDEALRLLNAAIAEIDGVPAAMRAEADLYRVRGLAFLRKAEIENCVNRHNRDCCIFPLQNGGVHAVSEPALSAKQDYLRYLTAARNATPAGGVASNGSNLIVSKWLLNIACMALAEYPEGVPEPYRIPPSTFASEADIGRFVDVAPQLGIDSFDHAGGSIVEDFDGDGLLDVVTSTNALYGPMKAFRNRGDGTFEDVAAAWRLDDQLGGLHIAAADYDNDGDTDIVVPRGAWMLDDGAIRRSLLRNDGAVGFTDVTREAGVADPPAPSQAVVWADFDNDGWLDLFCGNESRVETEVGGTSYPSQLFRNEGNGHFADVTAAAGVANDRYAKGACAGDYDDDGDMDLYVSNIGLNRLYRNDGGMHFVDVAPELHVTEPSGRSFATWFFDHDNDGDLDLWVNSYDARAAAAVRSALGMPHGASAPCLYRNDGGRFVDIAKPMGLDHAWLPMGASFGDFDNDGWLDVYLGTGDPSYESLVPNIALRNDRGRGFQDITESAGLGHLQKGHGVTFADIDEDGDQDIHHQLGGFFPGDAFRNVLMENPGHGNHFLKVELVGTESNRQGIGTRITVNFTTPQGPRKVHRAAGCVSSFGQAPRRQEIGLGNAKAITSLEVFWPASGIRQRILEVPLDAVIRVTEGEAGFQEIPLRPSKLGPKA